MVLALSMRLLGTTDDVYAAFTESLVTSSSKRMSTLQKQGLPRLVKLRVLPSEIKGVVPVSQFVPFEAAVVELEVALVAEALAVVLPVVLPAVLVVV